MKTYLYIKPKTKMVSFVEDSLMDVISLPTTGQVDDPSFGQAKEGDGIFDIDPTPYTIYSVWEEKKSYPIYDVWSEGEE